MFKTDFVTVAEIEGRGRGIISRKEIPAKTPLFQCESFGAFLKSRDICCATCSRICPDEEEPLQLKCHCESYYCSQKCFDNDRAHGGHELQCKTRERILQMNKRKLNDIEKSMALYLVKLLTKRALERQKREAKSGLKKKDLEQKNDECKTQDAEARDEDSTSVSSNSSNGDSACSSDNGTGKGIRLPSPTLEDYQFQIPDYPEMPGFEEREKIRDRVAKAVLATYHKELKTPLKEMLSLLRKETLNAFNLRDVRRRSAGWAVYPQASMMNHSCYPNAACRQFGDTLLFETIRDVKEGEEILQSYLGDDQTCGNWGFTCNCEKCVGNISDETFEEFMKQHQCQCGVITTLVDASRCICQDGFLLEEITS